MIDFKKVGAMVGLIVFDEILVPLAEDFVLKTENSYDDAALAMVKPFVRDLIKDLGGIE